MSGDTRDDYTVESLMAIIRVHNESCRQSCEVMGSTLPHRCKHFTDRERLCPDCPRCWIIEGDYEVRNIDGEKGLADQVRRQLERSVPASDEDERRIDRALGIERR